MFNDLLVLARKDWREKLHLVDKSALSNCHVCDIIDDSIDPPDSLNHMIELEIGTSASISEGVSSNPNRYLIEFNSKETKTAWIDAFKSLTQVNVIKSKRLSETESQFETSFAIPLFEDDINDESMNGESGYRLKQSLPRIEDLEALKQIYRTTVSELQNERENRFKLEEELSTTIAILEESKIRQAEDFKEHEIERQSAFQIAMELGNLKMMREQEKEKYESSLLHLETRNLEISEELALSYRAKEQITTLEKAKRDGIEATLKQTNHDLIEVQVFYSLIYKELKQIK